MVGAQLEGFEVMVKLSESSKYIVLEGNLSMGWIAFGPFNSLEDAGFFANLRDEMTWIMELHDAEPPQKPAMAQ